jgi:hypothetical protein
MVFYGYVRGTNLKEGMKVHLIGVGDYGMVEAGALPDPCPVFDKERESQVRLLGLLNVWTMIIKISLTFCGHAPNTL